MGRKLGVFISLLQLLSAHRQPALPGKQRGCSCANRKNSEKRTLPTDKLSFVWLHLWRTSLPWGKRAKASPCEEIRHFALGLENEADAALAALTEPWSTGPVEGHITRLKLLKRQMYGRANIDLLRLRVLHVA
nr:transposase [Ktedonobacter racemifer]